MVHESWCPRERRTVARVRIHEEHLKAVRLARALYMAANQGKRPRWSKPCGMQTVDFRRRVQVEIDWAAQVQEEAVSIQRDYGVPGERLWRVINAVTMSERYPHLNRASVTLDVTAPERT